MLSSKEEEKGSLRLHGSQEHTQTKRWMQQALLLFFRETEDLWSRPIWYFSLRKYRGQRRWRRQYEGMFLYHMIERLF